MERLTLAQIAAWCGAETALDGTVGRISIDSRDVDEDTLFIAIVGERFDGNDFVADVLRQGVKAVLCSRDCGADPRLMRVKDTTAAFLAIAAGYRSRYDIPFVGLTGSVGKTTSKGMVYAALNRRFKTYRTEGNLNNNIGVSKTLLQLDGTYEAAVIEMGMDHAGEISALSKAVRPDVGVITNVGTAHIETLGSRENILRAKCEILDGMAPGSPLVINGDNDMLAAYRNDDHRLYGFGVSGENLYLRAEDILSDAHGSRFTAVCETGERTPVFVPAVGLHNVYNALCAVTVGHLLGLGFDEAAAGVADFQTEGMRQNVTEIRGMTFIEDCYNANPDSMRAALNTLHTLGTGRTIAVLGDMLALGDTGEQAHRDVGAYAADMNCTALFTYGEQAAFCAEEARKRGVETFAFDDKDALRETLKAYLQSGDVVLFKGSRGMKMEDVFQGLYKEWNQ